MAIITGPPNGPALFCLLASVICHHRLVSCRARGRSGSHHCTAGQYGYIPLGRHLVIFVIYLWCL